MKQLWKLQNLFLWTWKLYTYGKCYIFHLWKLDSCISKLLEKYTSSLMEIHTEGTRIERDTCTPMFIAIYFRLWTLHLFFQTFYFVFGYSQLAMFIYFYQPISLHFQILWDLLNISFVIDNSILYNYIVFIDYSFLHNYTFPTKDFWRDGQKIHEPTSQPRSSISVWFWT